jgi:hypothetical protein
LTQSMRTGDKMLVSVEEWVHAIGDAYVTYNKFLFPWNESFSRVLAPPRRTGARHIPSVASHPIRSLKDPSRAGL